MTDAFALEHLVGEWRGTYRLWLEPGVLTSESPTTGIARPTLGGRFVTFDYDWATGEPLDAQSGQMLIGRVDETTWELAWIDTWHMGTSMMFCTGSIAEGVLGSYGAGPGEERWGWRTSLAVPVPDELVITSWNITPSGEESKATEATYRRHGR